jgi:hypothetical protein
LSIHVASADVREWTNNDGKTIHGEMVEKKDDEVTLKIKGGKRNGKIFKIKLSDLCEDDVKFIKENEIVVAVDPFFRCQTVKKTSYIPYKSKSSATIEMTLVNTKNADLELFVVWIGEGRNKDVFGVYATEAKKTQADGAYRMGITFNHYGEFSKQHKGHVVYVIHKGKVIDSYCSMRGDILVGMSEAALNKHLAR